MLADRIRMGRKIGEVYLAQDDDFSGTTNGYFTYIGAEKRLVIPHVIKGIPITSYSSMFWEKDVVEVRSNNPDITDMSYMFIGLEATSLDLTRFDTSNVTDMSNMFTGSGATSLDLSSFDTSNVTSMSYMFYNSSATTLDLSSFDTSKVTSMTRMFQDSAATTGYARTQVDADRFNNSSNKPAGLNFVVKP